MLYAIKLFLCDIFTQILRKFHEPYSVYFNKLEKYVEIASHEH